MKKFIALFLYIHNMEKLITDYFTAQDNATLVRESHFSKIRILEAELNENAAIKQYNKAENAFKQKILEFFDGMTVQSFHVFGSSVDNIYVEVYIRNVWDSQSRLKVYPLKINGLKFNDYQAASNFRCMSIDKCRTEINTLTSALIDTKKITLALGNTDAIKKIISDIELKISEKKEKLADLLNVNNDNIPFEVID